MKSNYIILDFIRFTLFTLFVYFFGENEKILFFVLFIFTIAFNIFTMLLDPFSKYFVFMETLFIEIIATISLLAGLFYAFIEENTSD